MKNIKFTAGLTALALGGLFINGSLAFAQLPTITVDTSNSTTTVVSTDATAGGTALTTSTEGKVMPGTGAALDAGVDALIKDTSDVGEDYCDALIKSFNMQDTDIRGSFAWNVDSYNRNLEASGKINDDQKTMFENTKKTIDDTNHFLAKVNAGGDDAKFRVIVRSALISLSGEFKKESGPDTERVQSLNQIISKSLACMNAGSNSSDEENIKKVQDSVVALATSWDEKKSNFGDTATTETMVKDEMVSYKESAKFLGFIPSKLTSKVVVKADGSITVKRPWYRFLFSQKSHKGIDEVQKIIDDNKIDFKSSTDIESRANALEILSTKLQADTEATVEVETEKTDMPDGEATQ